MLKLRGKPDRKPLNDPQPFCGLISCASCGMMITGEYKVKKQQNGNVHEYVYYHCTKKNKSVKCEEPCIRQEELDKQLSSLIKKVSLPKDWAVELNRLALQDHGKSAQSLTACVKEKQEKISSITIRLERLLNGYLDQDIDKEDYRAEKSKLLLSKKSLEEEIYNLSHKQNDWLEPFQNWLEVAQNIDKIASDSDLFAKKVCAKEIFGSNLLLGEKSVRASAPDLDSFLVNPPLDSGRNSGGNHWDALRASRMLTSKKPIGSLLVTLPGIEPGFGA